MEPKFKNHLAQQQKMNLLMTKTLQNLRPKETGQCALDQLQLQYQSNQKTDIKYLIGLLTSLLTYPSTQLAKIHQRSNRLGELYLKQNETEEPTEYQKRISRQNICFCCGLAEQKNTLILTTDLSDIRHIGVSTYLYFMTIKSIIILMLIMLIVYSIFALVTNILASNEYKKSIITSIASVSQKSYQGILLLSLGSKQLHETQLDRTYYTVQCCLGILMIVIWGVVFGMIKYLQRRVTRGIDNDLKSAADYTIFIKNLPTNMTKQELSQQLNEYRENLIKTYQQNILQLNEKIEVEKINIAAPYYLQRSKFNNQVLTNLNKQYKQYQQLFIGWIKQRQQNKQFTTPQQLRSTIIKQFYELKSKIQKEYQKIQQNIKENMRERAQTDTVPAFVTLSNNYSKQFLVRAHKDANSLLTRISCKEQPERYFQFKWKNGKTERAKIKRAPEPQDILWENQGQNFEVYIKKRIITYGITIILLGGSFAAIYGLSSVQAEEKNRNQSSSQYISILISICISVINIIINLILRVLTNYQRISTFSHYQIGLAIKGVFASLINSILIPILVNYFFKKNLYGENGLAEDVFYLGLTNSFILPILTIFNPQYFLIWLIRKYKSRPHQKLYLNQNQLNAIYENLQFQVGYQYIYIINLFLFTCFFVPLQPIIVFFTVIGLSINFWAKKYSLFARSQKPIPGNNSINTAVYQLIFLGPAFYTIGSFCWSHFFKKQFISIAPNLVSAILSLILFLIPYKDLSKRISYYEEEQKRIYQEDRIFLPSQYDRLNPLTCQKSIEQYKRFVLQKIQQPKSKEQLLVIQHQLMMMRGLGNRNYKRMNVFDQLFDFSYSSYDNNNIMAHRIYQNKGNTFNPLLLLNMTMPNNQNLFRVSVQNWNNDGRGKIPNERQQNEILGYNMQQNKNQFLNIISQNGLMIGNKRLETQNTNKPNIKYTQQRDIFNYNQQKNNIVDNNYIPFNLDMFGNLFRNSRHSLNVQSPPKNFHQQPIQLNFTHDGNNRKIPQSTYQQNLLSNQKYNSINPNPGHQFPQPLSFGLNPLLNMVPNNQYPYNDFKQNGENQRFTRNL